MSTLITKLAWVLVPCGLVAAGGGYALGCLHLRGREGRIEATDGRQVLVQSGYRFGFTDDVLVPGSKVLGCHDVDLSKGIGVGRAGEWLGIQVGSVVILLHVQEDGRFPKVDQILPNANRATSRLELSGRDATFLTETLPKLPSDDPVHEPITLDLNGKVCLRCRVVENGPPTQIVLPSSKLAGEAVLLNMNRTYLERALKLGFAEIRLYGPNSPALLPRTLAKLCSEKANAAAVCRHDQDKGTDCRLARGACQSPLN